MIIEQLKKYIKPVSELIESNLYDEKKQEIAKELDIPIDDVSQALDAVCAPVSLYDPVYSDGGDPLTVMDQVRDNKNTENQ